MESLIVLVITIAAIGFLLYLVSVKKEEKPSSENPPPSESSGPEVPPENPPVV